MATHCFHLRIYHCTMAAAPASATERARASLSISNLLNPADDGQPQPTPDPPSTPQRKTKQADLSRSDRIRIRALHEWGGHTYEEIFELTNRKFTQRQIQRACTGLATLQKQKKRKGRMTTPEKQQLQAWLEEGRNRYTPIYLLRPKLPPSLCQYGETAIRRAISDIDWLSVIRTREIERSDQNKRQRVRWCQEMKQRRPNPEDWFTFCFSDETWAMNDPMWKKRVLMHKDDDKRKYALKKRKPKGWMFWTCFAGGRKGPCFFWEKEYGGINAVKYIRYIIPLVACFRNQIGDGFVFQQDNAPSHRARATKNAFRELGIELVVWPPYSPDLSPIENVWAWMKDWMELHSPVDIQDLNPIQLRRLVYAAWEAVPEDWLRRLAYGMLRRLDPRNVEGRVREQKDASAGRPSIPSLT